LNQQLQRLYSNTDFELINLSFDAANSFSQLDFSKQLAKYDPDAVIVCSGGNEFYGYSCAESGHLLHGNIALTRVYNKIHDLRLVQGAAKLVNFITGSTVKPTSSETSSYSEIAFGSKAYKRAISNFESNLHDLLLELQTNNIPVIITTAVSDEKSYPPLKSRFLATNDSTHLIKLFKEGELAFKAGNYNEAVSKLTYLNKKNNTYALSHYYLGMIALFDHDYSKAQKYLQRSVDLDLVRVRAPEEINKVIRKAAVVYGCELVDLKALLESQTSVTCNLFLESNRLNLTSNIVLAEACLNSIRKFELLPELKNMSEQLQAARNLPITMFDSIYDRVLKQFLHARTNTNPILNPNFSNSFEEKMALSISNKETDWETAMNSLYDYYIGNKNYQSAFKIIESLALENPYNIDLCERAANTASLIGDSQLVVLYAKKAYSIRPDLNFAQHLFINYLKLDMPENALPYLKYATRNPVNGPDYSLLYNATCDVINLKRTLREHPSDIGLMNLIAANYTSIGNYETASKYIKQVLEFQPTNIIALKNKKEVMRYGDYF
jgi:tetratricopeptide (TPR) repeat protein